MLNENIKKLRKAKGLSQEELAVKLNVVRQTVSKWENGLSVPDSSMLIDVVFMLAVTVLCFIFGKTQEKYDKKEGVILVVLFIAYMAFAILRN